MYLAISSLLPLPNVLRRSLRRGLTLLLALAAAASFSMPSLAADLRAWPSQPFCDEAALQQPEPPEAAQKRMAQTQPVAGRRDIAWAWLASPSTEYPHMALGTPVHAGSLQVQAAPSAGGALHDYLLPVGRVFEDRVPRLIDLDGDGRDEIILIESDSKLGSALVVFGLRPQIGGGGPGLRELARSPFTGQPFRWMNPVSAADFDGDGRLEIVSVVTPHLGGLLTMYRFAPPYLVPLGQTGDASNHRMGTAEQQLAAIVKPTTPGIGPAVIIGDSSYRKLKALRWKPNAAATAPAAGAAANAAIPAADGVAEGIWEEAAPKINLRSPLARMTSLPGGACMQLQDASWWRVTFTP
jgi:FG-GAP-like repeat